MKVLKEIIENRAKNFKKMKMSREVVLQRKLHEEQLLGQRILVFLTTSSILLLSFTSLLGKQAPSLMWLISASGICASAFLIPHSISIKIELDALAMLLKEPKRSCFSNIIRGTSVCIYLSIFFLAIWIVSMIQIDC